MERVAVVLHLRDKEIGPTVKKVWRFRKNGIEEYTRAQVQSEIVDLFPDIQRRGLHLELWYTDDLAGDVSCSISPTSRILNK